MDVLFPYDDLFRVEYIKSATIIGFENALANYTSNLHLVEDPKDKLNILTLAWTKIVQYLQQNPYTPGVGNVVHFLGRYTVGLWFGIEWPLFSFENKLYLIDLMMEVYPSGYSTTQPYSWIYMFQLYNEPWLIQYLNTTLEHTRTPSLPPTRALEPSDCEFIQQEGILLIIHRLINMFDFKLLNLARSICLRVLLAWQDSTSPANQALRATPNAQQYIECVIHIYLVAISELDGFKELHFALESIERQEYCAFLEPNPFEKECIVIAKALQVSKTTQKAFLNTFLLMVPDRQFNNSFGSALHNYVMFLTHYHIRKLNYVTTPNSSLPHANVYEKLVPSFIKQRESCEMLMTTTAKVAPRLFTQVHNLKALKFAYEHVKLRTREEWYTTKLTILLAIICEENINLDDCKCNDAQAVDELITKEQDLAILYKDLAKLLTKSPYLEQEAWLTTFSLHPCKEYMDAVTKCGNRNLGAMKKILLKFKSVSEPQCQPKTVVKKIVLKPSPKPPVYDDERPTTSAAFLARLALETKANELEESQKKSSVKPTNSGRGRGRGRGRGSGRGRGRPPGKNAKLVEKKPPIIVKPTDKDKDSPEVIYCAAAGAAENLDATTKESLKYPAFALINSITDTDELIKYTDYCGEAQYDELTRILSTLQLQNNLFNDILALLIWPRYKRLTWSVNWKCLQKRCTDLLKDDKKKLQLIRQSMADANNRLTHLNIDYEKYKDKPQLDYGWIENGYEGFYVDSSGKVPKPIVIKSKKRKGRPRKRKPIKRTKVSAIVDLDDLDCVEFIDLVDEPKTNNKPTIDIISEVIILPGEANESANLKLSEPLSLDQPLYIVPRPIGSSRNFDVSRTPEPAVLYFPDLYQNPDANCPQSDQPPIEVPRDDDVKNKTQTELDSFSKTSLVSSEKDILELSNINSSPAIIEQPRETITPKVLFSTEDLEKQVTEQPIKRQTTRNIASGGRKSTGDDKIEATVGENNDPSNSTSILEASELDTEKTKRVIMTDTDDCNTAKLAKMDSSVHDEPMIMTDIAFPELFFVIHKHLTESESDAFRKKMPLEESEVMIVTDSVDNFPEHMSEIAMLDPLAIESPPEKTEIVIVTDSDDHSPEYLYENDPLAPDLPSEETKVEIVTYSDDHLPEHLFETEKSEPCRAQISQEKTEHTCFLHVFKNDGQHVIVTDSDYRTTIHPTELSDSTGNDNCPFNKSDKRVSVTHADNRIIIQILDSNHYTAMLQYSTSVIQIDPDKTKQDDTDSIQFPKPLAPLATLAPKSNHAESKNFTSIMEHLSSKALEAKFDIPDDISQSDLKALIREFERKISISTEKIALIVKTTNSASDSGATQLKKYSP